jgi:hypothetical protein
MSNKYIINLVKAPDSLFEIIQSNKSIVFWTRARLGNTPSILILEDVFDCDTVFKI